MANYSISPALRTLYARQRELMDAEYLTASERRELCALPGDLEKAWTAERARRCRETHGAPRTIVTGADPYERHSDPGVAFGIAPLPGGS